MIDSGKSDHGKSYPHLVVVSYQGFVSHLDLDKNRILRRLTS